MYRRHGDKLALVFGACDLAITTLAWFAAYWVRFGMISAPRGVPDFDSVLSALPIVLLLAVVAYRSCGLYEVHRLSRLPREFTAAAKAGAMLFLMVVVALFYRKDVYESRLALLLFMGLNTAGLLIARRMIWAAISRLRAAGLNRGRAIIVGSGRVARGVALSIKENSWTGLTVVGCVDEPRKVKPRDIQWLGSLDQLEQLVIEHNVDHVLVALPLSQYGKLREVYQAISGLIVEVQVIPDIPDMAGMRIRMLDVGNMTYLGLRQSPHYGWPKMMKRASDLLFGSLAMVLFAPLMLALAIAVKLTSKGPIFYRQARTGLGGRTFNMLKFRSMPVGAENGTGPIWSSADDCRPTRLGRFMRRWSLDELPQLFNVLRGDMSLVGPRPERGVFVEQFSREIPDYAKRHLVKSGMTGWAQVHGWRGDTSLRQRLRCDLYYISHWSIWLDLKILWLTIWHILRPQRTVVSRHA